MERPDLIYPYFNSDEHLPSHHYLVFCCDVIASILKYVDENDLNNVTITISENDMAKFKELSGEKDDETNWLMENGYKDDIYEGFYRHILFSSVKDFWNFMFESIVCAGKMKLSVAFALLRRPFKDTLGIIEWLIIDRDTVIDNLEAESPAKLEIFKDIAKRNTDLIKSRYGWDTNFDLRYGKKDGWSFPMVWNKALHLITTRDSKSGKGELNFVFADEETLTEFSNRYYSLTPLVMYYAVELIILQFESIAKVNEVTVIINKFNRLINFFKANTVVPGMDKLLNDVLEFMPTLPCPHCGELYNLSREEFTAQLLNGELNCTQCHGTIDTRLYITEYEDLAEQLMA